MYGRNNEIDFVKKNLDENNLIYSDKKRSLDWERSSQVQFLTQRFSDPSFEFSILTKDRLVNFISSQNQTKKQNYVLDNQTYGFAYEGKIYLNSKLLKSETPVHEYTHLWDNYCQKTNPELWAKGKEIFKKNVLFAEN